MSKNVGMFWELFPDLTGDFLDDELEFIAIREKHLRDSLNTQKSRLADETRVKLTKTLNTELIKSLNDNITFLKQEYQHYK